MANKKSSQTTERDSLAGEQAVYSAKNKRSKFSFVDYINITESYTSLILGIVVVIIASVLLVSFFKNKHIGNFPGKQDISAISTINLNAENNSTDSAEIIAMEPSDDPSVPTIPAKPSTPESPAEKIIPSPTLRLTPTPANTITPTSKPSVTPVPTKAQAEKTTITSNNVSYKVKAGETLWSIAEKEYKDGYKWVDIAKANNLTNPNVISTEMSLKLPKMETKAVAQNPEKTDSQMNAPNQAGDKTYTVVKGDDLWDIAVKQYNNGYRWVDIARVNNLSNPNTIHSGNILKLPR